MDRDILSKMEKEIQAWLRVGSSSMELAETLLRIVEAGMEITCASDEFVKEFQEIFPSRKLPTGKNFRSNIPDLTAKLKYFCKNYRYRRETMLEAAKRYVEHAETVRYQYVRTAAYFVYKKGEGSDLADWCERVLNEDLESGEPFHKLL